MFGGMGGWGSKFGSDCFPMRPFLFGSGLDNCSEELLSEGVRPPKEMGWILVHHGRCNVQGETDLPGSPILRNQSLPFKIAQLIIDRRNRARGQPFVDHTQRPCASCQSGKPILGILATTLSKSEHHMV